MCGARCCRSPRCWLWRARARAFALSLVAHTNPGRLSRCASSFDARRRPGSVSIRRLTPRLLLLAASGSINAAHLALTCFVLASGDGSHLCFAVPRPDECSALEPPAGVASFMSASALSPIDSLSLSRCLAVSLSPVCRRSCPCSAAAVVAAAAAAYLIRCFGWISYDIPSLNYCCAAPRFLSLAWTRLAAPTIGPNRDGVDGGDGAQFQL